MLNQEIKFNKITGAINVIVMKIKIDGNVIICNNMEAMGMRMVGVVLC